MWIVIGASGYLGSYVLKNIREFSDEPIVAVSRSHPPGTARGVEWVSADVTEDSGIAAIREASLRGGRNKVAYLAAYHKPDEVAGNPRYAWNTNVTALSRAMNALERVDCFFYSSTDSVYGESVGGHHFREDERCDPRNEYGRQKVVAEGLVTGYGHHVARFPFLIGKSLAGHKRHFYDEILDSLSRGEPVEMFADSYRSALDFDTASRCLVEVMERHASRCPPVLNISGDEDLSKYDIGRMMAREFGYGEELVVPISVEQGGGIFKTPRAGSTLMDNGLLKGLLGIGEIRMDISSSA